MKVLFLAYDTLNSGPRDKITYTFIEKEMHALSEKGVQVHFLSRNLRKGFSEQGIHYHALVECLPEGRINRWLAVVRTIISNLTFFAKVAPLDLKRAWSVATIEAAIVKLSRTEAIDILHSHFLWPAGTASSLSAQVLNIPLVSTLRGAELADMPEIDYGSMRDAFYRRATRYCLPLVSHFTAPSRFLADSLTEQLDVPSEKVSYLPNGVEWMETTKTPRQHSDGTIKLIAIGRLIARKNYELIIEVLGEMAKPNIHLLLVGHGNQEEEIKSLIQHYHLQDHVTIKEEMSKTELYRTILKSDCLVHPALWEGMPNVILECLAMGVPCLASSIPVHTEIIKEGVNGWLFDPKDQHSLNRKLEHILKLKDELSEMAISCTESTKSFTLDRKINGYIELYQNYIAKL